MLTFLVAVHLIVCFLLISLVLLQDPKGGAAGGIFGGSSNSLLGATGATSFLTKLTRGVAITFGVLCLLMVWTLKRNTGSVLDTLQIPAASAPSASSAPKVPNPETNPSGTATSANSAATAEDKATGPVPDTDGKSTAPKGAAPPAGGKPTQTK